mmetsp:Transcript_2628/g.6987  ORF Transcript_2628/g.6987 Transcript_2628/m.6987 type:complete len:101 (-) Transcript_2628:288-590(-)
MYFLRLITDERLDNTKSIAMRDKPKYLCDFRECIAMFTEELGVKMLQHSAKRGRYVSAFVSNSSSKWRKKKHQPNEGTYTGTIENKQYSEEVYGNFSAKQ